MQCTVGGDLHWENDDSLARSLTGIFADQTIEYSADGSNVGSHYRTYVPGSSRRLPASQYPLKHVQVSC
eukprot:1428574-Heterocapsa_arctica.AAC.1